MGSGPPSRMQLGIAIQSKLTSRCVAWHFFGVWIGWIRRGKRWITKSGKSTSMLYSVTSFIRPRVCKKKPKANLVRIRLSCDSYSIASAVHDHTDQCVSMNLIYNTNSQTQCGHHKAEEEEEEEEMARYQVWKLIAHWIRATGVCLSLQMHEFQIANGFYLFIRILFYSISLLKWRARKITQKKSKTKYFKWNSQFGVCSIPFSAQNAYIHFMRVQFGWV